MRICNLWILSFACFLAKSSRKLTFLYLANDVIQNSKKKGPEFTRDFEGVLVDACSHVARLVCPGVCVKESQGEVNVFHLLFLLLMSVYLSLFNRKFHHLKPHPQSSVCVCICRETDVSCRKHMERLLNIWQERSLYRSDFIQQLKLAIEDSNSPRHKAAGWFTHSCYAYCHVYSSTTD